MSKRAMLGTPGFKRWRSRPGRVTWPAIHRVVRRRPAIPDKQRPAKVQPPDAAVAAE
jgi:hypothetical protein